MAELGIIEKFHASHGSDTHEHDFKVEVAIEGKVDSVTGYLEGIDHHQIMNDVKRIILEIENKNLKEVLSALGFKSSGNEAIAAFFLNKLKDKYLIKSIKVWETEQRYAKVYADESKQ